MAILTVNTIMEVEMAIICFLFDPRNFKQRNPALGSVLSEAVNVVSRKSNFDISPAISESPLCSLSSWMLGDTTLKSDKTS